MVQDIVKTLINDGYVTVAANVHKISPDLIRDSTIAIQEITEHIRQLKCEHSFVRDGEEERDIFLVHRDGSGNKDLKYFLHISHDVDEYISRNCVLAKALESQCRNMALLKKLHADLQHFVLQILWEVDNGYEDIFALNLADAFLDSVRKSSPYGVTTLRGLWYPNQVGQSGARGHFDRDLLTAHLGDSGGQLNAFRTLDGGLVKPVSPEQGEILLFWGIKALWASNGKVMPLKHGSTIIPGQDRRALVQFNHVEVGRKIVTAEDSFYEYCAKFGVSDPDDWYRSSFNRIELKGGP